MPHGYKLVAADFFFFSPKDQWKKKGKLVYTLSWHITGWVHNSKEEDNQKLFGASFP